MNDKKQKNESSVVTRRSEWLFNKAKESGINAFVKKCGRLDSKTGYSFFLNFIKRLSINRRFIKPLKHKISLSKDESAVFYGISYLSRYLLSLEILSYGTCLLLFGIISFIIEVGKAMMAGTDFWSVDFSVLIFSCVMFIASMVLIFGGKNKSLSEGIIGSSLLSFIFIRVFGVRKESLTINTSPRGGLFLMILAGVFFGGLTVAVSPQLIVHRMILLLLAVTVINVPEAGVVMLFYAFPFVKAENLFLIVLFVWFCYFMKLSLGRRSFKMTFTDGVVFSFAVIVLITGITGFGDPEYAKATTGFGLILCFVLVSTLIKNRIWVQRCKNALATSCAIYGILIVFSTVIGRLIDMFLGDNDVVGSLYASYLQISEKSGIILLFGAFFIFSYFGTVLKARNRLQLLVLSVIMMVGIFLTYSWEIWISFLIGLCVYFVFTRPKSIYLLLVVFVVVAVMVLVLPESFVGSVLDFAGFSKESLMVELQNQKAMLEASVDNFMCGIGFSESSLKSNVAGILPVGTELIPFESGIYSLMLAQTGLLGFILYLFIFLLVIGSYTVWGRGEKTNKSLSLVGVGGISMLFSLAFYGIFDNFFLSHSVSLIFWMIVGLIYSSCKVMKDEADNCEDEEEKVFYVEKIRSEVE